MNTSPDAPIDDFTVIRPRLFGIAYRMLGTVADAEDIVQDVWVKWQSYPERGSVRDPTAFLVTMTTRLSINATRTARARRETYIGPWLPEPVDTSADPLLGAVRGEALESAVLAVMEKLSPAERAVFVLREAFDYPFARIAEIVETTEVNVRKLLSRARLGIDAERRQPVDSDRQRRLLSAFLTAAQAGDLGDLESLLAADVASYSDGGGAARNASKIPVVGRDRVARYVAAFAGRFWTGVTVDRLETNGRSAVLVSRDGAPVAWLTVSATGEEGIDRIHWVLNPAKLAGLRAAPSAR